MRKSGNQTYDDLMEIVGSRFRDSRKRLNVTQKVFGELIDLGLTTINRMEGGKISLPITIVMLALLAIEEMSDIQTFKKSRRLTAYTLKRERKALGLSKWRLAKYLGVSASTVGEWEAGRIDVINTAFISLAIFQLKEVIQNREDLRELTAEKAAEMLLKEAAKCLKLSEWLPEAA